MKEQTKDGTIVICGHPLRKGKSICPLQRPEVQPSTEICQECEWQTRGNRQNNTIVIRIELEIPSNTCLLNIEPLDKDGNDTTDEFMYDINVSDVVKGKQKP